MKMFKNILITALCIALVCGLASCGAKETADKSFTSDDEISFAAITEKTDERSETDQVSESETGAAETEQVSETETSVPEKTEPESTEAGSSSLKQKAESEYGKWGIAMSFEPTGAGKGKLVIERSPEHGEPYGELITGEKYVIKRYDNGAWIECDYINGTPQWIMLAYSISENNVYTKEIDYSYIYGVLPPGRYRIYKEISENKTKGLSETFYAEFTIEQQ